MAGAGKTVFVAGAGIAGLTLALALAKFGTHVVVIERQAGVAQFGAGIQISPNARRILDRLGLDEALRAVSFEPKGIDLYPQGAVRPVATLELGGAMQRRFGRPYAVMHRADLAQVLHAATRRFANIDIQFGTAAWSADQHDDGITLAMTSADGLERTNRGHALVGADGVQSQTRMRIMRGPTAEDQRRIAWRTLLPTQALTGLLALDRVSVLFGPSHHLVAYPLPHRDQVNIALFVPAKNSGRPEHPLLPRRPDDRLTAILQVAGTSWTPWPLFTVEARQWHRGAIGLIGDAAHAMLPFQAQGAAMAIEDAAVLAPLLVQEPRAETAFERYQDIRQPRLRRVVKTAATNGRIFHLPWPASTARDLALRLQGSQGHLRRLGWLYSHDAAASLSPEN